MTFDALGSGDKTLYVFSKANGHVADYGHCDLAWSRYAPREVFPVVIDWLDRRQPGVSASPPAGSKHAGKHTAVLVVTEPAEKLRCRFVTRSRTHS